MSAPAFNSDERRTRPTRATRAPLPTSRAVLVEHIRATGLGLRRVALITAVVVTLITVVVVLQVMSMGVVINLYEWPTMSPGLMGALLPIAIWSRGERFGPGFLWTLPVDRRRHALLKVAAGWVWLMAGVAVVALWLLALTFLSGGSVLPPTTINVLPARLAAAGPLDPATFRASPWAPGPMIWLVPFTAASASYLLGSAVALGSRYPLRWIIGIAVSYFFVSVASDAAGAQLRAPSLADAPIRAMHAFTTGRYGLDALLTARTATLRTTGFLPTGERAEVWRGVPDLADWRGATLLWTSVGLIALWAAASRHGEQRRR